MNSATIARFDETTLMDPYAVFDALRERDPVHYSDDLNGWVLTRYKDVTAAFKDSHFLSGNFEAQVKNQLKDHDVAIAKDFLRVRTKMMLHNDSGEHRRLRGTCNVSFGKKGIETLTPLMAKAVEDSIADLPSDGSWDFATQFAEPLSTRVIADLFKVPYSDREHFQKCSDDVSRFFGNSVSDAKECAIVANTGVVELENYFIAFLNERKQNPGTDLLSLLLEANSAGMLTEEEVISQCVLIMMAGHYTVIDQLCNSVHTFLQQGIWSALVEDNDLIAPALEESIRYDGSVSFMARTVADDMEFGGKQLKANDTVFLGMGAANRDPDVFPSPNTFNMHREKSRHIGFAYGPHQCIGMGLSRIEMGLAFRALTKKYPHLKLDTKNKAKRKCESLFFRGFYTLNVTA